MVVTGKYDELLKAKAIREASEIIIALKKGNINEVFKKTQLSWRIIQSYLFGIIKIKKKASILFIPQFKKWSIENIHFHSPVMIDVKVILDDTTYRIRMIAEKKAYVTHPEAKFRYNPNSIRNVLSLK